jgi:hypothetical protein
VQGLEKEVRYMQRANVDGITLEYEIQAENPHDMTVALAEFLESNRSN